MLSPKGIVIKMLKRAKRTKSVEASRTIINEAIRIIEEGWEEPGYIELDPIMTAAETAERAYQEENNA